MERSKIFQAVDHTLLAQTSTWEEIRGICDDAVTYGTASVCIPPCYVAQAAEYLNGKIPVCTVIGFPNGYQTTAVKCFEAKEALENGAKEIDMVINIGQLKAGNYDYVETEIRKLKEICKDKILKVIIETCLLTEEEKIAMCKAVTEAGADYIKTSTGFGTAGATLEDIRLFRENIGQDVKMKAAGGVKTVADMEAFLEAGCDRIGTSSAIQLIQGEQTSGY